MNFVSEMSRLKKKCDRAKWEHDQLKDQFEKSLRTHFIKQGLMFTYEETLDPPRVAFWKGADQLNADPANIIIRDNHAEIDKVGDYESFCASVQKAINRLLVSYSKKTAA